MLCSAPAPKMKAGFGGGFKFGFGGLFSKKKKSKSSAGNTFTSILVIMMNAEQPALILFTVILLSFWTDRSGQTVQTKIRLPLEEQSDQGLHCLLFHLHLSD